MRRAVVNTVLFRGGRRGLLRPAANSGPWIPVPPERFFATDASASSKMNSDRHSTRWEGHMQALKEICPKYVDDPLDMESYNTDWMRKYQGYSPLVLVPKSTEQVSQILKYCNDNVINVVPQSGNTGLVGGSVPVEDEVILSLKDLRQIISFDSTSGALAAEAGCILQDLDNHVAPHGFCMPLDLGAKGSCLIGGNIATNAGGLRLLRYGNLHGNTLGLEVVLPDGSILNLMNTLRKDNTGYDLKQLFIGAEGTLGIVTKVAIQTAPRAPYRNVALLGYNNFEDVVASLPLLREGASEILSGVEFIDRSALDIVLNNKALCNNYGYREPLAEKYPYYIIVETRGSDPNHDMEKLEKTLQHSLDSSKALDGILATDESQKNQLWGIRESVPVAISEAGLVFKYDVSVPLHLADSIVGRVRQHMKEEGHIDKLNVQTFGYGHLADSNVHINVLLPWSTVNQDKTAFKQVERSLEPWLGRLVHSYNGSISAEHGIGVAKRDMFAEIGDPNALETMRQFKRRFDPNNILNPRKVVPVA
eukprot:gb/GECG01011699.1/.p1 GENE.gb/GECG01011699.1/~~gb/GECG01011699.1/.p1  ORF type:complete len:534 (+),score=57.20 gb/GECG01011699.1/:1-1602(+)